MGQASDPATGALSVSVDDVLLRLLVAVVFRSVVKPVIRSVRFDFSMFDWYDCIALMIPNAGKLATVSLWNGSIDRVSNGRDGCNSVHILVCCHARWYMVANPGSTTCNSVVVGVSAISNERVL